MATPSASNLATPFQPAAATRPAAKVHGISIVIPVYRGESTLRPLLAEIAAIAGESRTPGGRRFKVNEVILVEDGAIDKSADVIRELARKYDFVRPLWLSRNFGQHAATLAGIAATVSPWVVTMDEDGQQNPADAAALLDVALDKKTHLVYAEPKNSLPHGWLRNASSLSAKWIFSRLLGNKQLGKFNSFRLVRGQIARSLAAYCGSNVYLDGALHWVADRPAYLPLHLRPDTTRRSGYSYPKLFDHFMRLVFTSRRPPLRIVSFLGCFSVVLSFAMGGYAVWQKLSDHVPVQGWTSLVIIISFFSGLLLFSAGIIAEYLGILLSMSMGKPLYLIVPEPPLDEDEAA